VARSQQQPALLLLLLHLLGLDLKSRLQKKLLMPQRRRLAQVPSLLQPIQLLLALGLPRRQQRRRRSHRR
jgi:hypothetical protein